MPTKAKNPERAGRASTRTESRASARPSITKPKRPAVVDANQLYDVEEAAGALGVGRTAMFDDIKAGRIRTVTRGRRRLVPGAEIVRVVADLAASAA